MFAEVKAMLPVSGDFYDEQIIEQIKACGRDLTTSSEIVLPGSIVISRTWHPPVATTEGEVPGYWTITDGSTLTDELVITAIATWCNMRIGNPPNYEQLLKAYNSLKGQMKMSKYYTQYGEVTAE